MRTETTVTIRREEYSQPSFWIDKVKLLFELDVASTRVTSRLAVRKNTSVAGNDLTMAGESMSLQLIKLNGQLLDAKNYTVNDETLTIFNCPDSAEIEIVVTVDPSANTTLMGLYTSGSGFFTQCEAEGFRRITYFLDRPDVMARYTVEIHANKAQYPSLLSNGNLIEQSDLPDGRHRVVWEDPFPKPSYLFALVAGKFDVQEERIKTQSGKDALLQVFVEPGNLDKTDFAMQSLKRSIVWDEQRFNLELDLERFMIVAVSDFNMGAMENKGLNIFNTAYVLANARMATDSDYANIEAVVGHEYFHNWTGNRVTCRDWFQLTLKEGLTVFRDQEFSADMMATGLDATAAASARAVKRIEDVRDLRATQFSEDAGPMAHPVRPESYQEIGNFYTSTVYEKGAEVIRMLQTLLGRKGFEEGITEYFKRHDGQAVTCEDFVNAMESVYSKQNPGSDLKQFRYWYSQAGTPSVTVRGQYDAAKKTYTLTLEQNCPKIGVETAERTPNKQPYHIPFALGLLDTKGAEILLSVVGDSHAAAATTRVLHLNQPSQTWVFSGVEHTPVPSLLRDFSAPVNVRYPYSEEELVHILAYDSDAFNRWEAAQTLGTRRVLLRTRQLAAGITVEALPALDAQYVDALGRLLIDSTLDASYRTLALMLPGEMTLSEAQAQAEGAINPVPLHLARESIKREIGLRLKDEWISAFHANQTPGTYSPDQTSSGKRSLKNLALMMWLHSGDVRAVIAAQSQFASASNMTDQFAALSGLVDAASDTASSAIANHVLQAFYEQWKNEPLVIDKWFSLQAMSRNANAASIRQLMAHAAFTLKNPNRARSVTFRYAMANPGRFHAEGDAGYAIWADTVLKIDTLNPELAARLARALERWQRFTPALKALMRPHLERVKASADLSRNTTEIIAKALQGAE